MGQYADVAATETIALPAIVDVPAWVVPTVENDDLANAWMEAFDSWLESKYRRSHSEHTIAAYRRDFREFFRWFGGPPWAVTGEDANDYLRHLEAQGLKPSTINRKLAALSSFYSYVIDKFHRIDRHGIERTIYVDPSGNPRPNPFKRPERLRINQYNTSRPIAPRLIRLALQKINRTIPTGARDYALIVTYLYTGRRSSEIAKLRWGDIEEDPDGHRVYYKYRGKGDKRRTKELPPPAYHAIRAFLKLVGRLETIQPDDYIFQPIHPDRAARLPNVDPAKLDPNRHITTSQINRIIKHRFAAAGINPSDVHTHTLRHTAAALRWREGEGDDILKISEFLDHANVSITQIYLSRNTKPIDDGWTAVEQLIMI